MKGSKDLFLHSHATDARLTLVVENRVSFREFIFKFAFNFKLSSENNLL